MLDLVAGSGIQAHDNGLHQLDGNAGEWRLFRVVRTRVT